MEFISKEEFLKQNEKVQRVFKEYFDRCEMLYTFNDEVRYGEFRDELDYTPNIVEGQLRKFIEDNINKKVDIIHYINEGYILVVDEDIDYSNLGHDLLQAYWKVACQVASKEVVDNGRFKTIS